MKNQFYAHGKFFEDQDEFFKFCREWPDLSFDLDNFKAEMEIRIREIETNYEMRGGNLTNRQAYHILRSATDWSVNQWRIEKVE